MSEVAKRLKKYRIEAGYSLKDLSVLSGISMSSLQRYESGAIENMPIPKLEDLAKALKISPACLMGWESKDLAYDEYSGLNALLNSINYSIKYDSKSDGFYLEDITNKIICSLLPEQIRSLNEKTVSYLEFELNKIINKT